MGRTWAFGNWHHYRILQIDVVSVYPQYGGQTVRSDLNRTFVPFQKEETNKNKVYIMWSNLQGNNLPEKLWRPNHFVTLIKMYPEGNESITVENDYEEELPPISFFDDSDADSINFDTNLIDDIINELNVEVKLQKFIYLFRSMQILHFSNEICSSILTDL